MGAVKPAPEAPLVMSLLRLGEGHPGRELVNLDQVGGWGALLWGLVLVLLLLRLLKLLWEVVEGCTLVAAPPNNGVVQAGTVGCRVGSWWLLLLLLLLALLLLLFLRCTTRPLMKCTVNMIFPQQGLKQRNAVAPNGGADGCGGDKITSGEPPVVLHGASHCML